MLEKIAISIIIPLFNKENFIRKSLDSLIKQKNFSNYEIIIVDDASTDNSINLIKKYNLKNLKILSLKNNFGPSAARNIGLKNANGKYVYFLDADDSISEKALSTLYQVAEDTKCNYVFSDFKKFENNKNLRKQIYNYSKNRLFRKNEIKSAMIEELHNPSLGHLGLFGCNGRLIRRKILKEKIIFFNEKLRWMEDKTFSWKVLSCIKEARYIHKQLYNYYYYPKISTGVTSGFQKNASLFYIRLIVQQIENSLKKFSLASIQIVKLKQQALIFFSIQALVTISNQIFLKKIKKKTGKKIRKKLINNILQDKEITKSIKNYSCSNEESELIPKAIYLRSTKLLEKACDLRAKKIAMQRRGVYKMLVSKF